MTNNQIISSEILNKINYPVYYINNDSEIIVVNKAFLAMLDLTCENDVLNKSINDFVNLINTDEDYLNFSTGEVTAMVKLKTNNIIKTVKVSKSIIHDGLMMISLCDVSDIVSNHNNRSEYLAKVSREVRVPLNTIVGLTELSKKSSDINEIYENMIKISNSSSDLIELVNSIFDINSLTNNKMSLIEEPVDMKVLTDTVKEIFKDRCLEKHIDFEIENKVEDVTLIGDYNRIQKILINLISNAIKFNNEYGEVIVTVEAGERTEDTLQLLITVKDNGRGFSEEFAETIFEPYTQENELAMSNRGIGLGLTVVKYLVELMNGNIKVTSKVNQGSEFVVDMRLPYIEFVQKNEFKDISVLIIDDDEKNCQYISMILDHMNIKNEYLSSSIDALDLITKNYHSYNLYIVDYALPYVDGITLSRQINSNEKDARIILMSNYDSEHFKDELNKINNYYLLQKPANKSTLYNGLIQSFGSEIMKNLFRESHQLYNFSGNNVLIVEDFDMNAEILRKLLEKVHINCDWVKNGDDAIRKINEKGEYYYQLVFMDIMMEGLDGYQTTVKIREMDNDYVNNLQIYAMTAESFEEDIARSMESGMNGHFPKPINVKLLYNLLSKVLARKGE